MFKELASYYLLANLGHKLQFLAGAAAANTAANLL